MIYGKIDAGMANDGTLLSWSKTKLRAYVVIASVANHHTGEFWHSIPTLAAKFGCSTRHARTIMREFEDEGILSARARPGKTTIYTYTTALAGAPQQNVSQEDHQPGAEMYTSVGAELRSSGVGRNSRLPPNNNQQQQLPGTTTAADRISPILIKAMAKRHGKQMVQKVVVAMGLMDGHVRNADAYFRTCCEKKVIPTTEQARQRAEEMKRKKAVREKQELLEQKWQKWEEEAANSDPEVVQRYLQQLEEILSDLDEA
jgi:hypothetical protein